jgi:guanylate kinase
MSSRRGRLFILSAPSGTGKTTLAEHLVERVPNLRLSRSYTSRPERQGETDGVDYNFISRDRFEEMIARGEFLEWADVFGNLYGTLAADTERVLASGEDLMLVIDVQGARQVRSRGIAHRAVFVLPPSYETLERRLRGRSKDHEAAIRRRLEVASREIRCVRDYDYIIVNDDVASSVERLKHIVMAERARPEAMRADIDGIIESFERRAVDPSREESS